MLRVLLLCSLTLLSSTASAEPVIDLYWQDCGGPTDETFTCATNSGRHQLVATFRAPFEIPDYVSSTTSIELVSDGAALPAWWTGGFAPGECRQGAFQGGDATGLTGCTNPYDGTGFGIGVVGYSTGWMGDPRRAQLTYDAARSEGYPIAAGSEVIASLLVISNFKTIGATGCAGCQRPVCIVIKRIRIDTGSGGSYVLSNPPGVSNAQYVTWQGGVTGPGDDCPAATPAPNRTWGEVKALYR